MVDNSRKLLCSTRKERNERELQIYYKNKRVVLALTVTKCRCLCLTAHTVKRQFTINWNWNITINRRTTPTKYFTIMTMTEWNMKKGEISGVSLWKSKMILCVADFWVIVNIKLWCWPSIWWWNHICAMAQETFCNITLIKRYYIIVLSSFYCVAFFVKHMQLLET